jgi:hypothetical protein
VVSCRWRFAPQWQPLFWELADRTPEELVQAAGAWHAARAGARAERAEPEVFREAFAAVLRRIEELSETERAVLWRYHPFLRRPVVACRRDSSRETSARIFKNIR